MQMSLTPPRNGAGIATRAARSRLSRGQLITAAIAAIAVLTSMFAAPASATTRTDPTLVALQQSGAPSLPGMDGLAELEPLPTDVRDSLLESNADALRSSSGVRHDLTRAEALEAGDLRVLRLPAAEGQGVIAPSSLSIFVDADGNRVSVIETTFYAYSDYSGRAKIYTDGKLTFDQVVTDKDAPASARADIANHTSDRTTAKAPNGYVKGDWWGNLNKCLSAAGIAGWAITALAIACSVACVGTAGVACVPCLVALTGGAAGTISYCVRDATYYS